MAYKSDIRDSTIEALLKKVKNNNYERYLKELLLSNVRGFNKAEISFDFPVTAIIGPNGSGKSTILNAAACAYKSIRPSFFFKKNKLIDTSMERWRFHYELIEDKESVITSTKYSDNDWKKQRMCERFVTVLSVSRTRPATEVRKMEDFVSNYKIGTEQIDVLNKMALRWASKVLGKDISNYFKLYSSDKKNIMLCGKANNDDYFSEFHFGSGEANVIRMISEIEDRPINSLILIEEIENGLHPLATRKIVEYLINVSKRKSIQIIFTTHSNEALMPLPSEAIWATINNELIQGKLDIKVLRAISGKIDASLAIFVEDSFAKNWIESIIAEASDISEDEIEIHPMAGDGSAIKANKSNNSNPAKKFHSICIIDGDSNQQESDEDKVYRLPGQNPEQYIFDEVFEIVSDSYPKIRELSLLLQKRDADSEKIMAILNEVKLDYCDPHILFSKIP
jgi:AAA15 family ATPase/GTPase